MMSGFPSITGPVLETRRLVLRPPRGEDFEGFAAMSLDGEHVQFVGGRLERPVAFRVWCTIAGAWMIRGFSMFSVIEKETGAWVGRVGPWYPEGWPAREVGWGVTRAMSGKGYALEAATACMDYVFDQLGWDDVVHIIDPGNAPSIALARRLGSQNRGPTRMPPPFQDAIVDAWGQTRADWLARRALP